MHRPWCDKILGTDRASRPRMTGGRGANFFGRSMIEMLGVLAIIAVLSVGGIAGYSKAMNMWKSNIQRNMITELIHAMIEIKPKLGSNLGDFQNITYLVNDLGYLPEGTTFENNAIYDKSGNHIEIHKYNMKDCKYYVMEIYFMANKDAYLPQDNEEFCRNLVLAIQPVALEIKKSNFRQNFGEGVNDAILFNYTDLADAKLSDIQKRCHILSKSSGAAHYSIHLWP